MRKRSKHLMDLLRAMVGRNPAEHAPQFAVASLKAGGPRSHPVLEALPVDPGPRPGRSA